MVFTASLLGAQQNRDSVENKLASFLVVSLNKTLNWGSFIFFCLAGGGAKQSTCCGGPNLTEDLQTEHER